MRKAAHEKNAISENGSEAEQNFLKRFSLKKVTVPREKLLDKVNLRVQNDDNGLREWTNSNLNVSKVTTKKCVRLEYRDLSKVMRANTPWWLGSRGVLNKYSGERLVSLVEVASEESKSGNERLSAGVENNLKKINLCSNVDLALILGEGMEVSISNTGPSIRKPTEFVVPKHRASKYHVSNNIEKHNNTKTTKRRESYHNSDELSENDGEEREYILNKIEKFNETIVSDSIESFCQSDDLSKEESDESLNKKIEDKSEENVEENHKSKNVVKCKSISKSKVLPKKQNKHEITDSEFEIENEINEKGHDQVNNASASILPKSAGSTDMVWIGERLKRVQQLLTSLEVLRLQSDCEKCLRKIISNNCVHLQSESDDDEDNNCPNVTSSRVHPCTEDEPMREQPFSSTKAANFSSKFCKQEFFKQESCKQNPCSSKRNRNQAGSVIRARICKCDLDAINNEIFSLGRYLEELRETQQYSPIKRTQLKCIIGRVHQIRASFCEFTNKILKGSNAGSQVPKNESCPKQKGILKVEPTELKDSGECCERQKRSHNKDSCIPMKIKYIPVVECVEYKDPDEIYARPSKAQHFQNIPVASSTVTPAIIVNDQAVKKITVSFEDKSCSKNAQQCDNNDADVESNFCLSQKTILKKCPAAGPIYFDPPDAWCEQAIKETLDCSCTHELMFVPCFYYNPSTRECKYADRKTESSKAKQNPCSYDCAAEIQCEVPSLADLLSQRLQEIMSHNKPNRSTTRLEKNKVRKGHEEESQRVERGELNVQSKKSLREKPKPKQWQAPEYSYVGEVLSHQMKLGEQMLGYEECCCSCKQITDAKSNSQEAVFTVCNHRSKSSDCPQRSNHQMCCKQSQQSLRHLNQEVQTAKSKEYQQTQQDNCTLEFQDRFYEEYSRPANTEYTRLQAPQNRHRDDTQLSNIGSKIKDLKDASHEFVKTAGHEPEIKYSEMSSSSQCRAPTQEHSQSINISIHGLPNQQSQIEADHCSRKRISFSSLDCQGSNSVNLNFPKHTANFRQLSNEMSCEKVANNVTNKQRALDDIFKQFDDIRKEICENSSQLLCKSVNSYCESAQNETICSNHNDSCICVAEALKGDNFVEDTEPLKICENSSDEESSEYPDEVSKCECRKIIKNIVQNAQIAAEDHVKRLSGPCSSSSHDDVCLKQTENCNTMKTENLKKQTTISCREYVRDYQNNENQEQHEYENEELKWNENSSKILTSTRKSLNDLQMEKCLQRNQNKSIFELTKDIVKSLTDIASRKTLTNSNPILLECENRTSLRIKLSNSNLSPSPSLGNISLSMSLDLDRDSEESIKNNSAGDAPSIPHSECCCCEGVPPIESGLATIIQNRIKNQKRGTVFLKFTMTSNNLFHIQMTTARNTFLSCFYATEKAVVEARRNNGFDGCVTLSVMEPSNTPLQVGRLVDHAFMVVQQDRKCQPH